MPLCHLRILTLSLVVAFSLSAVAQTNPVPFLSLPSVPASTAPGGPDFSLTVNGAGFVAGSTVNWNGTPLVTTFITSSRLSATVPAAYIATPYTAWITVSSAGPGGGTSNKIFFPITNKATLVGFTNTATLATGNFPQSIAVEDFNGDGKLDLAVANASSGSVSVFLGNGDGTFQPRVDYATPATAVTAADLTGDGKISLIVSTGLGVAVLLGNGDGTFQPAVDYAGSACGLGFSGPFNKAVAADLNGDGKLDLAVPDFCYEGVGGTVYGSTSVFLGNGDGTFQPYISSSLTPADVWIAAGDFDADGVVDLAGSSPGCESPNCRNSADLAHGNGDGTFTTTAQGWDGGTANFSPAVQAGDFNEDGNQDFIVCNAFNFSVVLGNGDGTLRNPMLEGSDGCESITTGDFHGNGHLDVAKASKYAQLKGMVLAGDGSGRFTAEQQPFPTGTPDWVVAGDFNGDGRLDLAVADISENTVRIDLQSGLASVSPASLNFSTPITTTSAAQPISFSNPSGLPVTISVIAASSNFTQTNNCPMNQALQPGMSCTINVEFSPTASGNAGGTLSVTNNGAVTPLSVALSGVGEDFSLSSSAPSQTVSPGQVANYSVQVTPIDGYNYPVSLSCKGAPPGATCTLTPVSVTLNGSSASSVAVAVNTTARFAGMTEIAAGPGSLTWLGSWPPTVIALLLGTLASKTRRRSELRPQWLPTLVLSYLFLAMFGMSACGGGSGSGGGSAVTQSGTYTLTVTGEYVSGSNVLTHTQELTLVVN